MQLTTISVKSLLAAAIRYALGRMEHLRPYLDNGILKLDKNAASAPSPSTAPKTTRSQRSMTCCLGAGTDSGQTGRLGDDCAPYEVMRNSSARMRRH